jgi:hypothetical protein
MRRTVTVLAMLAIAFIAIGVTLLSGGREVTSSVDRGVTIRCPATTTAEACGAWGDGLLAAGAPSSTFEMVDLVRLELRRGILGIGTSCEAVYFIGRYPDEPVWDEAAGCPHE